MKIGSVNNIGFKGNYNLFFKNDDDASAFARRLNTPRSEKVHELGDHEARIAGVGTNVVVSTVNPQYSLNDRKILQYGVIGLENQRIMQEIIVNKFSETSRPINLDETTTYLFEREV